MESLTSAISVQVDAYDKEVANGILKKLGLNMSTYVNMAIKQLINKNGVPFEVVNPKPSNDMIEASKELEYIKTHLNEYPHFNNWEDLEKSLLSDD